MSQLLRSSKLEDEDEDESKGEGEVKTEAINEWREKLKIVNSEQIDNVLSAEKTKDKRDELIASVTGDFIYNIAATSNEIKNVVNNNATVSERTKIINDTVGQLYGDEKFMNAVDTSFKVYKEEYDEYHENQAPIVFKLDNIINRLAYNPEVTKYFTNPVNISGGSPNKTYNWTEYVSSLPGPIENNGWRIAFNIGNNAKNITTVPPFARCAFGCGMNSIALPKDTPGPFKTVGGWSCQFRQTDDLFIRTIKAMVAKILTVSGLYNSLNYTSEGDHTMSATRFTVGGGADFISRALNPVSMPPVYEDAVELYLRLPLLVEFYRDIYSLTGKKLSQEKSDELIVTLVPEMDLTWSGIMRLSFDNMNGAAAVTKNYAAQMIVEINKIYEKYKGRGSSLVTDVVNDFVTDVNRRFGLMSRVEGAKYREMMQANRRAYAESSEADILMDYDILGDRDYASNPAPKVPSNKFTNSADANILGKNTEFKFSFIEAITKFREHIDDKIQSATIDPATNTHTPIKADFHEQARITRDELKLNTDLDKRFNIVFATMTGIDSLLKIDDNANVMFHETIIAPMNIIACVETAMLKFISNIDAIWGVMLSGSINEPRLNTQFIQLTKFLMAHVSSLSGLVDMNISSQKVIIDHSKLQQFVESVLEFVNRNLQKFRGLIDSKIITDYEGKIQKIQTDLVETIFRNELGISNNTNLERMSSIVTRMYGIFANGKDVYSENETPITLSLTTPLSLCSSFKELAYYNPTFINTNFSNVKSVLTRDSDFEKLFMKKIDGKDIWMYEDLLFAARREIYLNVHQFSMNDNSKNRSMGLMMRFNELLARYLNQFWDNSAKKIYLPLILKIAAENDAAVYRGTGWPDLTLPRGHSNLPPSITSSGKWANDLFKSLMNNNLFINMNIPSVRSPRNMREPLYAFLDTLDISSSGMAPTQVINILKHVFDTTAAGQPPAVRSELEEYRNLIINAIGDYWAKYGIISAIAAATKAYDSSAGTVSRSSPTNDIEKLLKESNYIPPGVVPAAMSEFSGILNEQMQSIGNPDEILFASLGKVLKTMLTAQDKGIPMYTIASLSDTSATTPRMKENIRANLPIFVKMFSMLAESCKILGSLLTTGINISEKYSVVKDSARVANSGVQGRVFASNMVGDGVPFQGNDAKNYISRILSRIANSCNAIVTSAADVMREVSDNPLFLETGENSIAAYRTLNNVIPFMPLSSMLAGLRNKLPDSTDVLLPLFMPGARKFEFNYGTRFILGQPKQAAMLDHAPGVREIVENYNKLVQSNKQISLDSYGRAMVEYVQLTRWLVDLNVYAPILLSDSSFRFNVSTFAYQQDNNTSFDSILELTTNSDKRRMISVIGNFVYNRSTSSRRNNVINRELMQVWNLLDMNVNPVNMNALRREVPLINVINYGLTFDSMMKSHIGIKKADPLLKDHSQTWLSLMITPYKRKSVSDWEPIFNCFNNESRDLGFSGHDRFAQDQVFRKALMVDSKNVDTNTGKYGTPGSKYGLRDGYYSYHVGQPNKNRFDLTYFGNMGGDYLKILGMMRHDTTFIRNILFISSVHRLLRFKLEKEMTKITFAAGPARQFVNPESTEENPWETIDDLSFVG